jgi:hypothetical protein
VKRQLRKYLDKVIKGYWHYKCHSFYASQFKKYLKLQGFENKKVSGEDEYIAKWKRLCTKVEPYSYRFFSHYVGFSPNIVPEDIGRSFVEPILNPLAYRKAFTDKNLFPVLLGKQNLPQTIICRIHGSNLLDGDGMIADKDLNSYLKEFSSVILKPSTDSSSGHGIIKFVKHDNIFVSEDRNHILTKDFLLSYGSDFCLQEAIIQHDFMEKLCPTSVNTIRLCVYRSVRDEEPKITASIIRIGEKGKNVDNVHSGGMFCGINLQTGKLGPFVMDQYGNKRNVWNGVDFSSVTHIVPFWQDVLSFAKYLGTKIHNHRLIALDIALESTGKPILLEYNICAFSYWLFMLTGQEVFGEYTDEIIEYCSKTNRECCP